MSNPTPCIAQDHVPWCDMSCPHYLAPDPARDKRAACDICGEPPRERIGGGGICLPYLREILAPKLSDGATEQPDESPRRESRFCQCSRCSGFGVDQYGQDTCQACNGIGEVEVACTELPDGGTRLEALDDKTDLRDVDLGTYREKPQPMQPCPKCGGSGNNDYQLDEAEWHHMTCSLCNGECEIPLDLGACSACGGSGDAEYRNPVSGGRVTGPCSRCKGTGRDADFKDPRDPGCIYNGALAGCHASDCPVHGSKRSPESPAEGAEASDHATAPDEPSASAGGGTEPGNHTETWFLHPLMIELSPARADALQERARAMLSTFEGEKMSPETFERLEDALESFIRGELGHVLDTAALEWYREQGVEPAGAEPSARLDVLGLEPADDGFEEVDDGTGLVADILGADIAPDTGLRRRSRWYLLSKTSPSGKQLFSCADCGHVQPTPDKKCPECERESGRQLVNLPSGRQVEIREIDTWTDCPVCEGKGTSKLPVGDKHTEGACHHCGGMGCVVNAGACPKCSGGGQGPRGRCDLCGGTGSLSA